MSFKSVWGFDPYEAIQAQRLFRRKLGTQELRKRNLFRFRTVLAHRLMNCGGCSVCVRPALKTSSFSYANRILILSTYSAVTTSAVDARLSVIMDLTSTTGEAEFASSESGQ